MNYNPTLVISKNIKKLPKFVVSKEGLDPLSPYINKTFCTGVYSCVCII